MTAAPTTVTVAGHDRTTNLDPRTAGRGVPTNSRPPGSTPPSATRPQPSFNPPTRTLNPTPSQ
jgi:hypothetical protein